MLLSFSDDMIKIMTLHSFSEMPISATEQRFKDRIDAHNQAVIASLALRSSQIETTVDNYGPTVSYSAKELPPLPEVLERTRLFETVQPKYAIRASKAVAPNQGLFDIDPIITSVTQSSDKAVMTSNEHHHSRPLFGVDRLRESGQEQTVKVVVPSSAVIKPEAKQSIFPQAIPYGVFDNITTDNVEAVDPQQLADNDDGSIIQKGVKWLKAKAEKLGSKINLRKVGAVAVLACVILPSASVNQEALANNVAEDVSLSYNPVDESLVNSADHTSTTVLNQTIEQSATTSSVDSPEFNIQKVYSGEDVINAWQQDNPDIDLVASFSNLMSANVVDIQRVHENASAEVCTGKYNPDTAQIWLGQMPNC